MIKAWRVVRTIALLALALGAILVAIALVMDADLVRIAATVCSHSDRAKVIEAARESWGGILAVFGL